MYITKIPGKTISEKRSAKIKYVIGMIVTHRCIDNTTHIGVIVGWNLYYNPLTLGIDFNNCPILDSNMLCRNKKCADSLCCIHKPYYAIFCERNRSCYIEQGILLFIKTIVVYKVISFVLQRDYLINER